MTREERLKAIQEMDAVIERAEHACKSYELIQMEMMATQTRPICSSPACTTGRGS